MWLGQGLSSSPVSLPKQQQGDAVSMGAQGTDPGAGARAASCLIPADGTDGVSRERQWLHWLREGDLPTGHSQGRGGPWLESPALRTAVPWPHPCPPDLAPSPAQLTRPAVW